MNTVIHPSSLNYIQSQIWNVLLLLGKQGYSEEKQIGITSLGVILRQFIQHWLHHCFTKILLFCASVPTCLRISERLFKNFMLLFLPGGQRSFTPIESYGNLNISNTRRARELEQKPLCSFRMALNHILFFLRRFKHGPLRKISDFGLKYLRYVLMKYIYIQFLNTYCLVTTIDWQYR